VSLYIWPIIIIIIMMLINLLGSVNIFINSFDASFQVFQTFLNTALVHGKSDSLCEFEGLFNVLSLCNRRIRHKNAFEFVGSL
jgi:hypothetical protein